MILQCSHIHKSFGLNTILSDISFHLNEREKLAIVGVNGCGKSTLLKIITGSLSADSGEVILNKDTGIGYLAQNQDISSSRTIYEEMLDAKKELLALEETIRSLEAEMKSAEGRDLDAMMKKYSDLTHRFETENGYAYRSELLGVLHGLGFGEEDFDKRIQTLSGGQKTRVALAKMLLSGPDLLILDEPTNHLDLNSIAWLETYLSGYKGSVILVAHDRYFLNKIVTKVVEIERGKATVFSGNYSDYAEKKKQLREDMMKQYLNQQQEIRHQEAVIEKLRSFNREKSIKRAESREKMLDKIERLDKPAQLHDTMRLQLKPRIESGKDVLQVSSLSKAFGANHLFEQVSFLLKRGERAAIIGDNGTGKTTLLKIINELETADAGEIRLGAKVEIGYYDQEHQVLHMEKTLFEEIQDSYPELDNTKIRNVLAAFLFSGDDVFKRISDLSGGERGRLSLAKLMLSSANLLILDEPTNHLDMVSKEILEQALNHYEGTVLYVSHDRYFINSTATRILCLTGQRLLNYDGNYEYYLAKKEETERRYLGNPTQSDATKGSSPASVSPSQAVSENKLDWQQQKEQQREERKRANALKKTEEEIARMEKKAAELDEALANPAIASDAGKLMELAKEKEEAEKKLEMLLEDWEKLSL